jgi:ribosomal RNA-processing protein 1
MATIAGRPFPFGPQMASDDHSAREQALAEVIVWLNDVETMTSEDAEKFWYVIQNGVWKTDGVNAQHDFCKKIAVAVFDVPESISKVFIESFFITFAKDWGRIDKWRIEKYLVLVRYLLDQVVLWAKKTDHRQYLPELFTKVLNIKNGVGLQLQFVDVMVPYLVDLVQDGAGGDVVKPFTALFSDSQCQPALVKRINDKIVQPLIESDGEFLFGSDWDASLHFLRGLLSKLNASVKVENSNPQTVQLRFDAIKEVKQVIADLLKKQKDQEPVVRD